MTINNETVGISAEVAIANEFGVFVDSQYKQRANEAIINQIKPCVEVAFKQNNIPKPVKHIALKQNPIDFVLENGETLSVKSNQKKLGKVAPQIIGQPTVNTYFSIMSKELKCNLLAELDGDDTNENRVSLFKKISLTRTADVLSVYWKYMFDCDYLIHFYNILNSIEQPNFIVFKKTVQPNWIQENFSFSQSINSWNESCTLYYNMTSIGEFQAHKVRNCLKFRFNMEGIKKVFEQ